MQKNRNWYMDRWGKGEQQIHLIIDVRLNHDNYGIKEL